MSIRNKPNYGIYPINLSNAGTQDLPVIGTRIVLLTALSGATFGNVAGQSIVTGGTVAPSTIVNVHIGKQLGDPIPFSVNTKVNVDDAFEYVRLSWAAQNGVTAFFLIDDDRDGAGVAADSPAAILGGSVAIQEGGNTALVNANGQLEVEIHNGANTAIVTALGAMSVDQTAAPTPEGASFFDVTSGSGATVTTLVSPASNVNGILLRNASVFGAGAVLYADTSAPSSITDNTKRSLIVVISSAINAAQLPYPMKIPAGVGLYLAANTASVRITGTYTVL